MGFSYFQYIMSNTGLFLRSENFIAEQTLCLDSDGSADNTFEMKNKEWRRPPFHFTEDHYSLPPSPIPMSGCESSSSFIDLYNPAIVLSELLTTVRLILSSGGVKSEGAVEHHK